MSYRALALLVVGCIAGPSHGVVFKFAADNDPATWTFTGAGTTLANGPNPMNSRVLMVDDAGGPLPSIPMATEFDANFTLSHVESVATESGLYAHRYSISGTFAFRGMDGEMLLSATMTDGVFTVIGTALSWYPAGTIQAGAVTCEWLGGAMAGYDLYPRVFEDAEVEFRLSAMNAGGTDVALDPYTLLPAADWAAESSFAMRAIPAPGVGGLALVCGVAALRRRRS